MSTYRVKQDRTFGVLSAAMTNVQTTLPMTPDAASLALPAVAAPQVMAVIIEPGTTNEEIVWITAGAAGATAPTVARGQEGTTAVAHAAGVAYQHGPTVYDYEVNPINDVAWQKITASNTLDDEFNNGVLNAAWTQLVPSGTQSVVVGGDACSVKVAGQAAGSIAVLLKALGSFAIGNTIETAVRRMYIDSYVMAGPIITDGNLATSNAIYQMPYASTLSTRSGTIGNISNDFGSFGVGNTGTGGGLLYQRLKWVAANSFQSSWSTDGVQWTTFGKGPFALTITPAYIGLGTSTWGGANDALASYEYFRVI